MSIKDRRRVTSSSSLVEHEVAIVIPVYGATSYLRELLADLEAQWPAGAKVWFVVQGAGQPADGHPQGAPVRAGLVPAPSPAKVADIEAARTLVRETCAKDPLRYAGIYNEGNVGFTKAVNQGIAACGTTCDVLLLNTDIRLGIPGQNGGFSPRVGWLDALRGELSDSAIGIVTPRLVNKQGRLHHCFAHWTKDGRGLPQPELDRDLGQFGISRRIPGCIFACALISRRCLDRIGWLDERLPNYGSDTKYCDDAWEQGLATWLCAEVTLTHAIGASRDGDFQDQVRRDYAALRELCPDLGVQRGPVVNLSGPLGMNSGYGHLAWNIARALHRVGADVRGIPYYADRKMDILEPHLFDDLCRRSKPDRHAPTLLCGVANEARFLGGGRIAALTMLECDPIPASFIEPLEQVDEVWTYSRFNQTNFAAAGLTKPIHLVPPVIDTDYYHPGVTPLVLPQAGAFNIVAVFAWGMRKFPTWIRWAVDAFAGRDDVTIHLRCHGRADIIMQQIEDLRQNRFKPSVVRLITHEIPEWEMPSLYKAADLVVCPGPEGIGYPALQALAVGTPVMALDWGAGAEYVGWDEGLSLTIDGLMPSLDRSPYYEGGKFGVPSIDHFQRLLTWSYHHRAELRAKAANAGQRIRDEYSIEAAGPKYLHALERLSLTTE